MATYADLDGKIVLITGGAHGIGEAMVGAFIDQGALVRFCDIDQRAGRRLARRLGPAARFSRVDLLKENPIHRWIEGAGTTDSRIDVLVNNAAADPRIQLEETSIQDWDTLFARNLRAFFLTCREGVRYMPPGSAIINFSSITFHVPPSNMAAYVSTKAGIQGLTRSLARELGPKRIRVNTISPGWVMTQRQLEQFVTPAVKRKIRKLQCIPELIQPAEIAEVALFLASESSRALTGQELLVDRGWSHS